MKKFLTVILCLIIVVGMFSGCGDSAKKSDVVELTIGNWPNKDTDPELYETYNGYLEQMKEKYPNVKITPDSTKIASNVFFTMAASGQLPTMFNVAYTEPQRIINAGYAKDITELAKKYGYVDATNEGALDVVTKDGKVYGIPYSLSSTRMWYNMNLFEKAGLVNADGTPKLPNTYEELAETAKIIKDKTGKAGFTIMTKDTVGGWQFMNIAWSFGCEFMKKGSDGKWKATFGSKEGAAALQYIKDLKWKYNVLPENALIDKNELIKLFATDQVASSITTGGSWLSRPVFLFGMDRNKIATGPIMAGPEGRYCQIGGNVWMFSSDSTDEQVEAALNFLAIKGETPELTEQSRMNREASIKAEYDAGNVVLNDQMSVWENKDRIETIEKMYDQYTNVDLKLHNLVAPEDRILKAEEPVEAQKLYALLSEAMQQVLIDENADCLKIMKEKAEIFQKDILDHQTY